MLTAIVWQLIGQAVDRAIKQHRHAAVLAGRIHVPNPTPANTFAARQDLSRLNWTSRSPLVS